jgi:hypothetical protein
MTLGFPYANVARGRAVHLQARRLSSLKAELQRLEFTLQRAAPEQA